MEFKHPWEANQPAKKSRSTKEEFEELVKRATKKLDKPKQPKTYRMIDGVPHKIVNGIWVPLTKM